MIRILLADDHPVVRAGLRAMLSGFPDLEVVGEAETPEAAVSMAVDLAPDLVLMDLQFGPQQTDSVQAGYLQTGAEAIGTGTTGTGSAGTAQTGAEATRRIRQAPDAPAVLVLTNYDTDSDILGAVEAGASGYLLKDAAPEELIAAIRAAAAGETALAPAIAGRLLARMRSPQPSLSARETEVLGLVADGATNSAIAAKLHISDATVKSHLVHIYTKLGVSSRTAAVAAAREIGILK